MTKIITVVTAYWLTNLALVFYKDKVITKHTIILFFVVSFILGTQVARFFMSQKLIDVIVYVFYPISHAIVAILYFILGFIVYCYFCINDASVYLTVLGFTTILPFVFGTGIYAIKIAIERIK